MPLPQSTGSGTTTRRSVVRGRGSFLEMAKAWLKLPKGKEFVFSLGKHGLLKTQHRGYGTDWDQHPA
jgi:hypothetical protein